MKPKLDPRNDNNALVAKAPIDITGDPRTFAKLALYGVLAGTMHVLQHIAHGGAVELPASSFPKPEPADAEIMSADDVAAFLGVDRNTVYEQAGRGVIPHKRLGKRMIFRRETIRAWLDSGHTVERRA